MRLVWCTSEGVSADRCHCGGLYVFGKCTCCRLHHTRREALKSQRGAHPMAVKFYGPLIGPRMRLPQAKDVPEDVILRCLHSQPGKWWTHWPGTDEHMPSFMNVPELSGFPFKVVHAKLCSMERRGLIRGYGGAMSRGDWHVPGVMR